MHNPIHRLQKILQFIIQHPLAGRRKWRSVARFIFWQASQRFIAHDASWSFTSKTKLVLRRGLIGATGNVYAGLHDFEEMGFLLHFLRPGDVFADIGANAGSYTVLASGHVGATSLVFEPMPQAIERVKRNATVNRIEHLVSYFPVALGAEKTQVRFTASLDAENHVLAGYEKAVFTTVEVERFDDLCYPDAVPLLAKIDVEGYEMAVLKGMQQTLSDKRLKAIIIELNGSSFRYGYDEKQIHLDLLTAGFAPYSYKPFERKLLQLETFGSNNTIYIRDKGFVLDRVQHAEKAEVIGELF